VRVKAKGILMEALELPEKQRADLAGRLILSLHRDAEGDVEAAWAKEIDRRLASFEERKTRSHLWSSIRQSLQREPKRKVGRTASSKSQSSSCQSYRRRQRKGGSRRGLPPARRVALARVEDDLSRTSSWPRTRR
jgi:hypothetical protein